LMSYLSLRRSKKP